MRRNILAFILIGAFILLSCSEDELVEPCETYISGTVYFPDSTLAEDVTVRLIQKDKTTSTNKYGRYRFDRPDIDTCTVVASLDGYFSEYILINPQETGCSSYDFYLLELPCTPKSELPQNYPLGVDFYVAHFPDLKNETNIGDSLWISAYEWFQPPGNVVFNTIYAYSDDIWIISSLGDSEIKEVDEYRGGIPEIWNYGYIIDTQASFIPYHNNGILEVDPSGGAVFALYKSYWLNLYVCRIHRMLVTE